MWLIFLYSNIFLLNNNLRYIYLFSSSINYSCKMLYIFPTHTLRIDIYLPSVAIRFAILKIDISLAFVNNFYQLFKEIQS